MPEERQSILAQLHHPLIFFGLALLVLEVTFGIIATNSKSQELTKLAFTWMGGLFLTCIFIVAFLVYKKPEHIMLESQKELKRDIDKKLEKEVESLRIQIEGIDYKITHNNKELIAGLKLVNQIYKP